MNYIVKDLKLEKVTDEYYEANIKVHDILDVDVNIGLHYPEKKWYVRFFSHLGYKCFKTSNESCSYYTKYQFKSYNDAYDYANKKMKSMLNNFISSVLADIDDYIENIGESI